MALIECPECGAKISDAAEACPKCAYPISSSRHFVNKVGKVQTIEQTSKVLKIQKLISVMLMAISVIGCSIILASNPGEPNTTAAAINGSLFWVGLLWYIAVRFFSWWHHG